MKKGKKMKMKNQQPATEKKLNEISPEWRITFSAALTLSNMLWSHDTLNMLFDLSDCPDKVQRSFIEGVGIQFSFTGVNAGEIALMLVQYKLDHLKSILGS